MPEVAAKRTPVNELAALAAIADAFVHVFGRRPTQSELCILWVQSAHETAGWKSVPNNNPAGIKAGPGYQGDWRVAMTTEGKGADAKRVPQKFRAYATLDLGMRDWLDVLKRGYPEALEGARRGDLEAFVAGLLEGWKRSADYFTDDPAKYLTASGRWMLTLGSMPIAWADLCAPGPGGELLARELNAEGTGEA
jgi:hypothetical protein